MSVQPEKNGVCDSSNGNHVLDFEHEGAVDGNMHLLVEWLNHILPDLNLPLEASVEDLRACLIDGTVLCSILNMLSPGLIEMRWDSDPGPDNVKKFLAAMDELDLFRFFLADIQEGFMVPVLQCLERLESHFDNTGRKENILNHLRMRWNLPDIKSSERTDHYLEEKSSLYGERQRSSTNVKSPPRTIYSTVTSVYRQSLIATRKTSTSPYMSVQPAKNGVCDSSNGNHILDFEHEGTVDGNMRLLVEWLNHILPDLNLSLEASVEDLRACLINGACLIDGTVLCSILNKLSPGLIEMRGDSDPGPDKVKKFLAAMDELGLSMFVLEDMQEGYMVPVLQCLERLKSHFDNTDRKENILNHLRMRWNLPDIKSSERTDRYQEDTSPCAEKSSLYGEWQRSSTNVKSPPCTIYSTVTSESRQLSRADIWLKKLEKSQWKFT